MFSHHFSIDNIPFGIASCPEHPQKSIATRFEDTVIFLDQLAKESPKLSRDTIKTFCSETLNAFAALPKLEQRATRNWIQSHLTRPSSLSTSTAYALSHTTLHLPLQIGDFTDFSCSRDHVLNAGEAVFQKRELPPGFEHFPIGYHGRSSTIVVSGTPIVRPKGQYRDAKGEVLFGATKSLDYELEIAAVVGKSSRLGEAVEIKDADEYYFGLVLLNDWSARDIQALEMTPLGPMNGKSFGTSISPWVITLDALQPFKSPAPPRNPAIALPSYLSDPDPLPTFSIELKAEVLPKFAAEPSVLCEASFSSIYWTLRDLVAQQTVNGCCVSTGDLLATGTISGQTISSHGCLMEIAAKGGVEIWNAKGESEKLMFFEDGDRVSLSAYAGNGVGFGDCVGMILPAK